MRRPRFIFLWWSIIGGRPQRCPAQASGRVRERRNYRKGGAGVDGKEMDGRKKGSNFGSGLGTSLFWCGRWRHEHGLAPFRETGYWNSPDHHPESKHTLLLLLLWGPTWQLTTSLPSPILNKLFLNAVKTCQNVLTLIPKCSWWYSMYQVYTHTHTHAPMCVWDAAILFPTITYVGSETKNRRQQQREKMGQAPNQRDEDEDVRHETCRGATRAKEKRKRIWHTPASSCAAVNQILKAIREAEPVNPATWEKKKKMKMEARRVHTQPQCLYLYILYFYFHI